MIESPKTVHEVDALISTQVQENLHLDYKASQAIDNKQKTEISKDVSAFANSDGGTIIYGVIEKDYLPIEKDEGVDHAKYIREWLEQVINSNISPRIDGVGITQIPLSSENSIYVVAIQKSYRGPHQAADKKYYKRFNFQSVPMEDYEINDVRTRQNNVAPLLNIDVELKHNMVSLIVENIGRFPAHDVTFDFPNGIQWRDSQELPILFRKGAKVIPPKRRFTYFYHLYPELVNGPIPSTLDIDVSYFHPELGQQIGEKFHIDFMDFFNTLMTHSELYEIGEKLKKAIEDLKREMEKLISSIETISSIASPTGLDLSVRTTANLKHVVAQDDNIEKLDPYSSNSAVFGDVLGVDFQLAWNLESFFSHQTEAKKLGQVEGMTEELMTKLKDRFNIKAEDI